MNHQINNLIIMVLAAEPRRKWERDIAPLICLMVQDLMEASQDQFDRGKDLLLSHRSYEEVQSTALFCNSTVEVQR